ncbi:MAG: hypothetical protein KBA46_07705, partial [Candidatus Omnitrophica bacterium]|nr:hypothetical protein [Candidatus Omnitrophota bacterium]
MKNVRIVFIGGLLCLASVCHHGFAVYADDTSLAIRTRVDKNVIQIGDTVNYEIIVSADKRIEIEMPVGQKALGEFEIKDVRTSVKTVWGKKTIRQRYLLQAFSAGSWPLSAGAIKFKRSDTQVWHLQEVPQQTIEVTSVLTQQGQAAAMRDIKGPLGVVSWGLLLAAVFLLVAAILGLVIFLKNKKARLKQEPKRLAHEIALEQLAALKQQDLIRQGKIQEYFVVISDIIRHYIVQRFA